MNNNKQAKKNAPGARASCAFRMFGNVADLSEVDLLLNQLLPQDDWRDASRITWVESCLHRLVELCRDMKIRSLALPWMGTMNGWIPVDEIKDSTRRIMSEASDIDVSVYEIREDV